jgi:hypothetical protein
MAEISAETYVEDEILNLPFLTDGVMELGDLWDCTRSAKAPGFLFTKKLTPEFIEESLIDRDYKKIVHVKTTSDKLDLLEVKGEMKLEVMTNIIKIKGSSEYKDEKKNNEMYEKFIYSYNYKTYGIRANDDSKKLIDNDVIDQINGKHLKATHFVYAITLGAEINAEITVTQKEKINKTDVKAHALVDLGLKKINLEADATLNYLDHENNNHLSNNVVIQSAPALRGKADTINVLQEEVKNIYDRMKEKNFLKGSSHIEGVAIRYELWPIKNFAVNSKISGLYRKLNNREFEEFESMLIRMCDIRNPNYVTKELMKAYPEIFIILDDRSAQLTKEIIKYENEIRATATEFLLKASEKLQNYKMNISSIGQLLELVKEYEDKCQSNVIKDKINKFITTAKGYYSIFSFNNL